jgi:hypothetical protein
MEKHVAEVVQPHSWSRRLPLFVRFHPVVHSPTPGIGLSTHSQSNLIPEAPCAPVRHLDCNTTLRE